MIGPLVQGVLLVGVIYWYSKGMLTVINEYYRDEFKSYLAKNEKKNTFLKPKPPPPSTESDDESSGDPSLDVVDLSPKVEGLPDILNTQGNSIKRDGIVTRGFESSLENINNNNNKNNNNNNNNNDLIPLLRIDNDQQKSEKNSNEDSLLTPTLEDSCNVQQLLDFSKFNYNSRLSESCCKVTEKPILNPSAGSKLDYEQITNQQVPINAADARVMTAVKTAPATESIIAITTPTILVTSPTPTTQEGHDSSTGNCPSNIGCYRKTSLSGTSANVRVSKLKYQIDTSNTRDAAGGGSSRIGGSGVDNNRITAIAACRRKSVTEMVQFWSNIQDGGGGGGGSK